MFQPSDCTTSILEIEKPGAHTHLRAHTCTVIIGTERQGRSLIVTQRQKGLKRWWGRHPALAAFNKHCVDELANCTSCLHQAAPGMQGRRHTCEAMTPHEFSSSLCASVSSNTIVPQDQRPCVRQQEVPADASGYHSSSEPIVFHEMNALVDKHREEISGCKLSCRQ